MAGSCGGVGLGGQLAVADDGCADATELLGWMLWMATEEVRGACVLDKRITRNSMRS